MCHRIAGYFYGTIGAFGITAGAHRLWAHKSYKATWQLRLILATVNLIAFQNSIHEWVRDHRVHHKYTDTNADPHNAKRGFFFSHMGWLVLRKHPDVKTKGANISMADLEEDQIVMFQKKLEAFDFRLQHRNDSQLWFCFTFVQQILFSFDANIRFYPTDADSASFTRREIVVLQLHCWSVALLDDIAFHVACEQCGSYLGNETV